MNAKERKEQHDKNYKKAKEIRVKIQKGQPTTFQERNVMKIIEKKLKKEKALKNGQKQGS